ncbi:hypothetical protein GGR54DRAFT_507100 [Hypoxylon sp. NC1633]|nr:hypothetical protein GGR54DRAFT_507100 [Hypoxylon sp. NC1633]
MLDIFKNRGPDRSLVALSILEIVWIMTESKACFDPRDRVFGTFGFFGETLPSEFSLSHKMGLDELYSTFYYYLLAESASNLGVEFTRWWPTLHSATLPEKRSSLPSWCPDFHYKVDDGYIPNDGVLSVYGFLCKPRFEAGTKRPIMIQRGIDWSEIKLRGRVFDSVSVLHPAPPSLPPHLGAMSSGTGGFESLDTLRMSIYRLAVWERDLAARVVEAPVGSIEPSDMFEAYWQTLVGNELPNSPYPTRQDFLDFQGGLRRIRELFDRLGVIKRLKDGTLVEEEDVWDPSTPEEEGIYKFMTTSNGPYFSVSQAMQINLRNKRPFTTTSGRFGYGSMSVEEGDILCVFNGSIVAHLIRRKDRGQPGAEVYQLVGEAFVHGMMYGEIDDLDIEEQDITLV